MTARIALGSDDLRIIGHSINWELNVPYEHSPRPRRSGQETATLNVLFADLCALHRLCLSGVESALIEAGASYSLSDGRVRMPAPHFRLMAEAVASFLRELGHSPAEMEVVTGLPLSRTLELLARLQRAYQEGWGNEFPNGDPSAAKPRT